MRTDKVLRRLARLVDTPELLDTVARDVGVALARGERDALRVVMRELAVRAPEAGPPAGGDGSAGARGHYWAGFAAAIGMLVAAYESEHERADVREAVLRAVSGASAQSVLCELAAGPATGAELSARLHITPGGVARVLRSLRGAGLVRAVGGGADAASAPAGGVPRRHVLTPLGASIADGLTADGSRDLASPRVLAR